MEQTIGQCVALDIRLKFAKSHANKSEEFRKGVLSAMRYFYGDRKLGITMPQYEELLEENLGLGED